MVGPNYPGLRYPSSANSFEPIAKRARARCERKAQWSEATENASAKSEEMKRPRMQMQNAKTGNVLRVRLYFHLGYVCVIVCVYVYVWVGGYVCPLVNTIASKPVKGKVPCTPML